MNRSLVCSGSVSTTLPVAVSGDDGGVTDSGMRDRRQGRAPSARRPHGPAAWFSLDPEVVAVLRIVVVVAALWAVLFALR